MSIFIVYSHLYTIIIIYYYSIYALILCIVSNTTRTEFTQKGRQKFDTK